MSRSAPDPGLEREAGNAAGHGRVWFGISGAPDSTPRPGTVHAVARCRELGLDALEIAWVHSVTIGQAGAGNVRAAAERHRVRLSVHAPYYINLNSADPEKRQASRRRALAAARAAEWCGARDVVLHLGYSHGEEPAIVFDRMVEGLALVLREMEDEGIAVTLRPENMGRRAQFGDLSEILGLCRELPALAPCIDIAHLHARTGAWNSRPEFHALWDAVADALGPEALARAHVHISGIEFAAGGERRHRPLGESDLDYVGFLEVMAQRGVAGSIICESPARESDAVLLSEAWRTVASTGSAGGG